MSSGIPQNRYVPKSMPSALGRRRHIQNRMSRPTPPPPTPPSAVPKQIKKPVAAKRPSQAPLSADANVELERGVRKTMDDIREIRQSIGQMSKAILELQMDLAQCKQLITLHALHSEDDMVEDDMVDDLTSAHDVLSSIRDPLGDRCHPCDDLCDDSNDREYSNDSAADDDFLDAKQGEQEDDDEENKEEENKEEEEAEEEAEEDEEGKNEEVCVVVLPGGEEISHVRELTEELLNTCRKIELMELCDLFEIDTPPNPRKATLWALVANHMGEQTLSE